MKRGAYRGGLMAAAVVCTMVGSSNLVTGCGDSTGDSPTDGGADVLLSDAGDAADATPSNSLNVKVLDNLDGSPVPGAKVTVVDAAGVVQTATTAASGAFTMAGVAVPFAVKVAAPDPRYGWLIYDHISVRNIVLGTTNKPLPELGWADHNLKDSCTFLVPPCYGLQTCPLRVSIYSPPTATDTPAFGQTISGFSGDVGTSQVQVRWTGTSSTRQATLDAVFYDEVKKTYFYATKSLVIQEGQPLNCGLNTLVSVPNLGTAVPTTTLSNVSSSLTLEFTFGLTFKSGGSVQPLQGTGLAPSLGIPDIGLTGFGLTALATDYINNDKRAAALSPTMPPTASTVNFTLYGPPTVVSSNTLPAPAKLKWSDGSGPATFIWGISELQDGGSRYLDGRIISDQNELSLQTVEKLGVSVPPGNYQGTLGARRPATPMDVLVGGPNVPQWEKSTAYAEVTTKFTIAP